MTIEFVHLHLHTQYSLLDGAIKIGPLLSRVKELGMDAVAVTDHGSMMGTVEFASKAKDSGVTPIYGCEVYVAPGSRLVKPEGQTSEKPYHLILLAETDEGYRNLVRLVSQAHVDGFYRKPRVDKELLRANAKGLIATSACLQGEISVLLGSEGEDRAALAVEEHKEIFGADNYFLEVQDNGLPEQAPMNERLIRLARRTGTPLIATNDCHYLTAADATTQEILLCIQTGKTLASSDRMSYSGGQFHVKSPEDFDRAFGHLVPEALSNTVGIARRCRVKAPFGKPHLPTFPVPQGTTEEGELRRLSEEGLTRRFREMAVLGPHPSPEKEAAYRKRLDFELDVIIGMKYPGYFLIVADYIDYARNRAPEPIPVGPGRGSAAGSLVAYALRITDLDPIPLGLLFERFLNPERVSLPDIDSDFCERRRPLVFQYLRDKYGTASVSQVLALGTMKARAAIRDVGRVMGIPLPEVDKLAKLIPPPPDPTKPVTLEQAYNIEPRMKEAIDADPRLRELFDHAKGIEGLCRNASTHAAGAVISNGPITDFVPLCRVKDDIVTQFDKDGVEKAGLVKFDLLGLTNLTAIDNAVNLVRETKGVEIDLSLLPLDDEETYAMLSRGDTTGVFQCESGGFTTMISKIKPTKFSDIVDALALYRPGPLKSGMVDEYVARKHGRKPVEYAFPELKEVLRDTHGVIVYQEQVMMIPQQLASFTLGEADILRRAMGKKKADEMAEQRARFVSGGVANGHPKEKLEALFNDIGKFAEYGFNKSHSAAYGLITWQTAWLKCHHPVEYFSALMSSVSGKQDEVILYIAHCKEKGIPIEPPDVNESRHAFHPSPPTPARDRWAIRFGLSAIKGLGAGAIESILEARAKEGPFLSVDDFLVRVNLRKVNKKAVESLVKAGAFDSLSPVRGVLYAELDARLTRAQEAARDREVGQSSLFGGGGGANATKSETPADISSVPSAWSRKEMLKIERDTIGFYVSGHPLETFVEDIELCGSTKIDGLRNVRPGARVEVGAIVASKEVKVSAKTGERWAALVLEDMTGTVEALAFPRIFQAYGDVITSDEPLFIIGRVKEEDEQEKGGGTADEEGEGAPDEEAVKRKIVVDEVFPLHSIRDRFSKTAELAVELDRMTKDDIDALKAIVERHAQKRRQENAEEDQKRKAAEGKPRRGKPGGKAHPEERSAPSGAKVLIHLIRDAEFEAVVELPSRFNLSPSLDLARDLRHRFGYDVLKAR